jgi:hypothetical protein
MGPFMLPDRLSAQRYHDFLEPELLGAVRQRVWFKHDGAQAHCEGDKWLWLNVSHPGKWTGCRGTIVWPPRSSDPTPTDSLLKEQSPPKLLIKDFKQL